MELAPEEKFICTVCIGEKYLAAEIEREEQLVTCSYCEEEEIYGCSLPELTEYIETAFDQHYERQSENIPDDWPLERIKYEADEWEPEGQQVVYAIMDAAEISEDAASDVQSILEEKHYSRSSAEIGETSDFHEGSYYDLKSPDDSQWAEKWSNFEDSLKTKTRFFSRDAYKHLHSVFQHVEHLKTRDKQAVVKTIGPGLDMQSLYRARAFQSDAKLKTALESPDTELGPPLAMLARAGRMNANGISIFYGASNAETALAEIRPPVGSKVILAKFNLTRALKVLDLSALSYSMAKGSIFDDKYAPLLSRISFLRKLGQRMTRPIMPDDEHFEYLSTQAIADFLASEMGFDGIIFPSAQSQNGLNVALLNHACRVEKIAHPKGTTVAVSLVDWDEDSPTPNYDIDIAIPEPKEEPKRTAEKFLDFLPFEWKPEDPDQRENSLAVDTKSIEVAHISSVKINSEQFRASYREYRKSPGNPFGFSDD
ncbi:MAG: RES domain-containing protein [Pedobacter agri]